MTHQCLQSNNVATALPEESIGEAMPKLVRGEGANAGASTDSPHHPHQRLTARRGLRVDYSTDALVLRHPLLDLDGEQVIVKLRLQFLEARPRLGDDLRIEGQPVPMMALPVNADSTANTIEVRPLATDDLRPSESRSFHKQDRRPFARECRRPHPRQLIEAWAVDVWLALATRANVISVLDSFFGWAVDDRRKLRNVAKETS